PLVALRIVKARHARSRARVAGQPVEHRQKARLAEALRLDEVPDAELDGAARVARLVEEKRTDDERRARDDAFLERAVSAMDDRNIHRAQQRGLIHARADRDIVALERLKLARERARLRDEAVSRMLAQTARDAPRDVL